jgi:hypothetical protein
MYHHFSVGMVVFSIFYAAIVAGFLYLFYCIAKSLRRIADRMDWIGEKVAKIEVCLTESAKEQQESQEIDNK